MWESGWNPHHIQKRCQMEQPVFIITQHPKKVAALEFLVAFFLSLLLYILFLIVAEIAYRKGSLATRIPLFLHLIIILLLLFLMGIHAWLSHSTAMKRQYRFYSNRVEFERKAMIDPHYPDEVIFYTGVSKIHVFETWLDKLFGTGTIQFDEFKIAHIPGHKKIALFLNDRAPKKVILS